MEKISDKEFASRLADKLTKHTEYIVSYFQKKNVTLIEGAIIAGKLLETSLVNFCDNTTANDLFDKIVEEIEKGLDKKE